MLRKSTLNINYSNKVKLGQLDLLIVEMKRVVNLYIDTLWLNQDFKSKFTTFKVDTYLSSRLQQCLGKQALQIVKSQRKRKKKTKPLFKRDSFELDSRFVDFKFDSNSFDVWVKLSSLGNKLSLKLPSKKHKHFNKFSNLNKWEQKKSIKLRKVNNSYFIDCYFEKVDPSKINTGRVIGCDIGYKKLLIDSDNIISDLGLEDIYTKISNKKVGSKAFKRALVERDNLINQSINNKDLTTVKELVVEDLKDVKKNSKGRIFKKFNNKLQRWTYPKVLNKLSMRCEEEGILFTKINPAYTSQRCSKCGVTNKTNRKGESYKCTCGLEIDADLNAAINISYMGVYSPHAISNIC